jgi:hypothetical protein
MTQPWAPGQQYPGGDPFTNTVPETQPNPMGLPLDVSPPPEKKEKPDGR